MLQLSWPGIILVFIGPASIACGEISSCSSDDCLPTSHPYITPAVALGNTAQPNHTSYPRQRQNKAGLRSVSFLVDL